MLFLHEIKYSGVGIRDDVVILGNSHHDVGNTHYGKINCTDWDLNLILSNEAKTKYTLVVRHVYK